MTPPITNKQTAQSQGSSQSGGQITLPDSAVAGQDLLTQTQAAVGANTQAQIGPSFLSAYKTLANKVSATGADSDDQDNYLSNALNAGLTSTGQSVGSALAKSSLASDFATSVQKILNDGGANSLSKNLAPDQLRTLVNSVVGAFTASGGTLPAGVTADSILGSTQAQSGGSPSTSNVDINPSTTNTLPGSGNEPTLAGITRVDSASAQALAASALLTFSSSSSPDFQTWTSHISAGLYANGITNDANGQKTVNDFIGDITKYFNAAKQAVGGGSTVSSVVPSTSTSVVPSTSTSVVPSTSTSVVPSTSTSGAPTSSLGPGDPTLTTADINTANNLINHGDQVAQVGVDAWSVLLRYYNSVNPDLQRQAVAALNTSSGDKNIGYAVKAAAAQINSPQQVAQVVAQTLPKFQPSAQPALPASVANVLKAAGGTQTPSSDDLLATTQWLNTPSPQVSDADKKDFRAALANIEASNAGAVKLSKLVDGVPQSDIAASVTDPAANSILTDPSKTGSDLKWLSLDDWKKAGDWLYKADKSTQQQYLSSLGAKFGFDSDVYKGLKARVDGTKSAIQSYPQWANDLSGQTNNLPDYAKAVLNGAALENGKGLGGGSGKLNQSDLGNIVKWWNKLDDSDPRKTAFINALNEKYPKNPNGGKPYWPLGQWVQTNAGAYNGEKDSSKKDGKAEQNWGYVS